MIDGPGLGDVEALTARPKAKFSFSGDLGRRIFLSNSWGLNRTADCGRMFAANGHPSNDITDAAVVVHIG